MINYPPKETIISRRRDNLQDAVDLLKYIIEGSQLNKHREPELIMLIDLGEHLLDENRFLKDDIKTREFWESMHEINLELSILNRDKKGD